MKIPALSALVVFFSSFVISGAYAQTGTQGVPNGQHRVAKGGAVTSTTTNFKQIKGWEHHLTESQPNLKHYTWVPMLEAGRQYRRVAPGRSQLKGISHYPKPRLAAVPNRATYKPRKIFVPVQHHSGIYIKPRHIATVRPSKRPTNHTQIAWSSARTNVRLAAPNTDLKLSAPNTGLQLASPQARGGIYIRPRHVPTVRPTMNTTNTALTLQAPRTTAQLATRQTIARLAHQDVSGQLAAPNTAVELSYDACGGMLAQKSVYANVQSSRVKGHVLLQPTKAY